MKVEVSPKFGCQDHLTVTLDGEPWRELHIAVYGRNSKLPKCSARDEWEALFRTYEYQKAKNYLLRRLSAQHYHSILLEKLMVERLLDPSIVSQLIQESEAWGLLDDRAWVESFIRVQKKRNGMPLILAKLRLKGFNKEMLREIQEKFTDPHEEKEAILHLLKTKYRSKDLTQFPIKQKVIASLMRKGYAYSAIQGAMSLDGLVA